jgi:hypothetical protein
MRKIARYIYVGVAWLELVSIFIPFFLAGMSLFVSRTYWSTHADFGWGSELPVLILIIVGLLAWIPRRLTAWLVAMTLLHIVHTTLPGLEDDLPIGAAFHPVTALLLAWVAYSHARRATHLLLEPREGSGSVKESVQVEPNAQS